MQRGRKLGPCCNLVADIFEFKSLCIHGDYNNISARVQGRYAKFRVQRTTVCFQFAAPTHRSNKMYVLPLLIGALDGETAPGEQQ